MWFERGARGTGLAGVRPQIQASVTTHTHADCVCESVCAFVCVFGGGGGQKKVNGKEKQKQSKCENPNMQSENR